MTDTLSAIPAFLPCKRRSALGRCGSRYKPFYKACNKRGQGMKHVQHVRRNFAPLDIDKRPAERQVLAVLNRIHAIVDEARDAYEAGRPTLLSPAKLHCRAELQSTTASAWHRVVQTTSCRRRGRSTPNRLRLG